MMETRKKSTEKRKSNEHNGNEKKKYIITLSLYEHLAAFKRIGLKIPSKEFIDGIEQELVKMVKDNFSGSPIAIEAIPFSTLCDGIIVLANKVKQLHPDALIVSTAPLIAFESGGECVHLNRLVDFNNDLIGIGPRPGHPSLQKQLRFLKRDSMIIIEDGSFSGSSMKFLLDSLPNVDVQAIVLGVLFPKAAQVLEKHFKKELLCHLNTNAVLMDWMPSHDFFPFVPNCGRVVGSFFGKTCFPVYLYNHASLSMPYIYPYGKPDEWASIRGDRKVLSVFSSNCLRLTRNIFEMMNELNDKNITVGDLIYSSPRTSIPVASDQEDFSDLNDVVTDILTGDIQFLS